MNNVMYIAKHFLVLDLYTGKKKRKKAKNINKQTKRGAPEVTTYSNKDCSSPFCILWGMMADLICKDFLLDYLVHPRLPANLRK